MTDQPPKRYESELTVVIDRDKLPPRSTVPGPTITQLADIERARRDLEDGAETMVPCPTCEHCPGCTGCHMVSPTRAARLRFDPEPPPEAA